MKCVRQAGNQADGWLLACAQCLGRCTKDRAARGLTQVDGINRCIFPKGPNGSEISGDMNFAREYQPAYVRLRGAEKVHSLSSRTAAGRRTTHLPYHLTLVRTSCARCIMSRARTMHGVYVQSRLICCQDQNQSLLRRRRAATAIWVGLGDTSIIRWVRCLGCLITT
jgi:hypothetical protein